MPWRDPGRTAASRTASHVTRSACRIAKTPCGSISACIPRSRAFRRKGRSVRADVQALGHLDLRAPDLLKIDVEGHEAKVLDGARGTIETARPLVVSQSWYRPNDADAMRAPFKRLSAFGYAFYSLHAYWTPAGQVRLRLEPIALEHRHQFSQHLNVLAVPADRREAVSDAFRHAAA
jgi:hypothetical protein